MSRTESLFCFILLSVLIVNIECQYNFGAFVATNSFENNLVVFNATSENSIQTVCHNIFGNEIYTPAYTINTATRNLVYLKSESFDSPYDILLQASFNYNATSGTFSCGSEEKICESFHWRTNDTSTLFTDPSLDLVIMVDTYYYQTFFNEIRVWAIDSNCTTTLLDSFLASNLDVTEEFTAVYDQSNHIIYYLYTNVGFDYEENSARRLRAFDVKTKSIYFDIAIEMSSAYQAAWLTFNAANGYLYMINGNETDFTNELNIYQIDPISLKINPVGVPPLGKDQVGPSADCFFSFWRESLFSTMRLAINGDVTLNTFNSDFSDNTSFPLTEYFDNGLFYDPLLQIEQVNINTASEEELENGLPGMTTSIATEIVQVRNFLGPFYSVDSLLTRIPNLSFSLFQQFRPWVKMSWAVVPSTTILFGGIACVGILPYLVHYFAYDKPRRVGASKFNHLLMKRQYYYDLYTAKKLEK